MSNTYYTSLTGMLAASYGLQNASHNVANMQSPGFKRSDVFYSSLGDGKNHGQFGSGVTVAETATNFSAGKYLGTGNPADFAIVGQGFFIVRLKNGEILYTRNGEFNFNSEGVLVDKRSGGFVQGYNAHGDLVPIQQTAAKTLVGKATRHVNLAGDFILVKAKQNNNQDPDPIKSDYENIQFTVDNIFDAKGKAHKIEFEFKPKGYLRNQPNDNQPNTNHPNDNRLNNNRDGLEWELIKASYDGINLALTPQFLEFSDLQQGAPASGQNFIDLQLPSNQLVTFNFGNYMSDQDKSVRLNIEDAIKPATNITVYQQDGNIEGNLIGFSFDENGQISWQYDNNQTIGGIHIALAKFDDLEHNLIPANDNLFRAKTEQGRQIGRANKDGFGNLQPGKIETSNVDSTTEFANIIVLQRMFQACSQIMEIDKQLLEELHKK